MKYSDAVPFIVLGEEILIKQTAFQETAEDEGSSERLSEAEALKDIHLNDDLVAPRVRTFIHDILIKMGVYSVITDEQLRDMVCVGGKGRKKYDFIRKGTKYIFESWDKLDLEWELKKKK